MRSRHLEGEAAGYTIYSDVEVGLDDVKYCAQAENDHGKVVYHTTGHETRKQAVKMLILALGGAVTLVGLALAALIYF